LTDEAYIGVAGEIFDGCSEAFFKNSPIYIKHFSIRDQKYIYKYFDKYKKIAEEKGIPSQDEMLASLHQDGVWTDEDDLKIVHLQQELEGLKNSQRAVLLPSQKANIQKIIESKQKELSEFNYKKDELLGQTSESYATKRSNEEFIRCLLYKDYKLKINLFTDEEFSEVEDSELNYLIAQTNEISKRLNDENIQKTVLQDFFNIYMSQAENMSDFFGKPIVDLSVYQLKLAFYARVFYNIIQNHEDLPETIKKDPAAIFNFLENKKNISKFQERNKDSNSMGSAIFNATKEDLDLIDPNAKRISLKDEIEKKGGSLNMEDFINLMS
jgi:hypothetical protein